MKLIPILTALSSVLALAAFTPTVVSARNSFSANQQMILNNFGMQEQKLSDSINGYVSSGQLSPQQGASFQNQLSQLSDDAMYAAADPGQTTMMINRFSSFANQITGSLQSPGAYNYVPTNSVYSLRPRNHYTNWQSRWQTSPRYNSWLNQSNDNLGRNNSQGRYDQGMFQRQQVAQKMAEEAREKQANELNYRAQQEQALQRRSNELQWRNTHQTNNHDVRHDDHHDNGNHYGNGNGNGHGNGNGDHDDNDNHHDNGNHNGHNH